jgi:hypothetical protein
MGAVGVVLAAGAGTRLRPLTHLRPKALCPVANVPLIDHALARIEPFVDDIAVNVHHHRELMERHLADRGVHVSTEDPYALGTAGALGQLREWVDGRAVVVTNADTWYATPPPDLLEGWDGERVRLLVVRDPERADVDDWRFVGTSVMPGALVRALAPEPSGLWEVMWSQEHAAGRLDLVNLDADYVACDTPAEYLRANLLASGGASVIGEGAVVEGEVIRSVVWPHAVVHAGERLCEQVRAGTASDPLTVDAAQEPR